MWNNEIKALTENLRNIRTILSVIGSQLPANLLPSPCSEQFVAHALGWFRFNEGLLDGNGF
jgi:hypothetical protein